MNENYLLAVQLMQLPVVAIIVFVSLNPRITGLIFGYKHLATGNFGIFAKDNPLKFIAIGFTFNLFYLLLNVTTNPKINLTIFRSDVDKPLMVLFDILTAASFLLVVFPYLLGKAFIKNIIAKLLLALIAAFIIINNWNKEHIDSDIFNFICYGSLAAYMAYQIVEAPRFFKKLFSVYLLIGGFLTWSVIQLLTPLGVILNITENSIALIGFGISTISKLFILFGFYAYSIQMANHARDDQAKQYLMLAKKVEIINTLQNLINEISNTKNTDSHALKVVQHLTAKNVFNYDYAIFSEVDYLHKKIKYKKSDSQNDNIRSVENWVRKEGVPFGHHDIMAEVVAKRKTIHVKGDTVDGVVTDLSLKNSVLDELTYNTYDHKDLNRFFIPVFQLEHKIKTNSIPPNRVVAIIELGYHKSNKYGYNLDGVDQIGELSIYLDNSSQSYERLINDEIAKRVEDMLKIAEEESKDDHFKYLKIILQKTCELISAEFCVFTFFSENRPLNSQFYYTNYPSKQQANLNNLINLYITQLNETDNDIHIKKQKNELLKEAKMKTVQEKLVNLNATSAGMFLFFSDKADFLNDIIVSIINQIATSVSLPYNEKKFHHSLAKLVVPSNAISDLEINIHPTIELLEDYFETSFVSIWLKDKPSSFSHKYSSDGFKSCFKNIVNLRLNEQEYQSESQKLISFPIDEDNYKHNRQFWDQLKKENVKSILIKPLKTQHQYFGFICVFFKTVVTEIMYEDTNLLNLVSIKGLITMQIHALVNAVKEISDSFVQNNFNSTLKKITEKAKELLNADLVILYKSSNGEDVFFKDVTVSNEEDLLNKDIVEVLAKRNDSHVELAEIIIKDKSNYFNNRTEYLQYIIKNPKKYDQVFFREDFWTREKIKSMAAIRLSTKIGKLNKAVGIMFINFRNEINFNEEIKRIIETFAAFASGGISNGFVFERNRQYLVRNLRMAKPILTEVLAHGALHNAQKTYYAITGNFFDILSDLDNLETRKKTKVDDIWVEMKNNLKGDIIRLQQQFDELSLIYRPTQELQITKVKIESIINSKLTSLAPDLADKLIEVVDNYSTKNIEVECDPALIGDVLFNILNNAHYALEKRGRLEIRVEEVPIGRLKIEIIDDGKGINPDIEGFILEPYVTDKPDGSGLGLAMSKLTIEQHGGTLRYTSKKGRTVFIITLPLAYKKNQEN